MAFGIYVHFPYCKQICPYCDFATLKYKSNSDLKDYTEILCLELQKKIHRIEPRYLDTIYFGGGTPSLMPVEDLQIFLDLLQKNSWYWDENTEFSIEINPGTFDQKKLLEWKSLGINRFSLGVQSFFDDHLKKLGREHSAKQTKEDIELLQGENFNLDLLYSLPNQNLKNFIDDLDLLLSFKPSHFSSYSLTLSPQHYLQKGRAAEEEQIQMFQILREKLRQNNYINYEISNSAKKNSLCRHNLNAWQGEEYWAFGMSAHSYLKNENWGIRFWNPRSYTEYKKQVLSLKKSDCFLSSLPRNQIEILQKWEALTDFCHTSLRLQSGIDLQKAETIYGKEIVDILVERAENPMISHLLRQNAQSICLNNEGILLSNLVFERFLFTREDAAQHSFLRGH